MELTDKRYATLFRRDEWEKYVKEVTVRSDSQIVIGRQLAVRSPTSWIASVPRKLYVPVRNLAKWLLRHDKKILLLVGISNLLESFHIFSGICAILSWVGLRFFDSSFVVSLTDKVSSVAHAALVVGEWFATVYVVVRVVHWLLTKINKID